MDKNLIVAIIVLAVLAACTVTIQVTKDSDGNTITNSSSTTNSADSADLVVNPFN